MPDFGSGQSVARLSHGSGREWLAYATGERAGRGGSGPAARNLVAATVTAPVVRAEWLVAL